MTDDDPTAGQVDPDVGPACDGAGNSAAGGAAGGAGEGAGEGDAGRAGLWRWRCADESGTDLRPGGVRVPEFASRQAAEDWLAHNFEDLSDDGVTTVTLVVDGRAVYGPMPLAPEG